MSSGPIRRKLCLLRIEGEVLRVFREVEHVGSAPDCILVPSTGADPDVYLAIHAQPDSQRRVLYAPASVVWLLGDGA